MKTDLFGNIIHEEEEVSVKQTKPSPFSFINNISSKKYPDGSFDDYVPYLTNLSFSQRKDTIFYANEMNKNVEMSKKMHFDFYFHSLPKRNYFAKWAKNSEDNLESIKEYYGCSSNVAKQYAKTLTEDQKKQISEWFKKSKGGK